MVGGVGDICVYDVGGYRWPANEKFGEAADWLYWSTFDTFSYSNNGECKNCALQSFISY